MSEDLAEFIAEVAYELDCEPDNEAILARISAWGLALEKIAAIARAALALSPKG